MSEQGSDSPGVSVPRPIAQSKMRLAVGRQMTTSKQTVPHFYVSTDVLMDDVLNLARRLSAAAGAPRVSVTACLVRALTETLIELPAFNSTLTADGYVVGDSVNIGIAVALEGGLLAPALLDCQKLDLAQTAVALDDLVSRARAGRLRAPEMGSGTFTLSNLGMYDVTSFSAIVIPPQVAILAVGRAIPRPVVIDGVVEIRSVMTATLSSDHRIVDGAEAARFLGEFKSRLATLAREG
jgi:pyruvate dehydrogenase E2 component (dihydrolipoamide acetyltransferase)